MVSGAAAAGTVFTLSTIATSSIEEIATGAPDVLRFFQLYIYRERQITVQLVQRVERAGFSALVLTVDTPFFGKRRDDNRNKFRLPSHLRCARDVTACRDAILRTTGNSRGMQWLTAHRRTGTAGAAEMSGLSAEL
jgi:isopentenyl diphosphate isomerase/L-lactate dehydrogenase-like FMN-dependent dehydrogenase